MMMLYYVTIKKKIQLINKIVLQSFILIRYFYRISVEEHE